MSKRTIILVLFLALLSLVNADSLEYQNCQIIHSFPEELDLSVSNEFKVSIDYNNGKLLLSNNKEMLFGKLPTELDGDYYGYLITSDATGDQGEWDIYFVKIGMPFLDLEEDMQRIGIQIYRAQFTLGEEIIFYEGDSDNFVVYGKVICDKNKLIVKGLWLRGAITLENSIKLIFNKLK